MKVSFKGDYALKIILDLSLLYINDKLGITQIKEISRRQDIPEKFLEQIVSILKQANYLRTTRGPKGGIALSKSPGQITIGEIIRLIDGTTAPIACVSCTQYSKCDFEDRCVFKGLFEDIRNKINDVVDNTNFQDLCDRQLQQASASFQGSGI